MSLKPSQKKATEETISITAGFSI